VKQRLSQLLTEALVRGEGMNDFLGRFLSGVAEVLGVDRLVLYDYDEHVDAYDLLWFHGHPADARTELRRRLLTLDVRRALEQREPYRTDDDERQLLVPLYFQDTLEAVLLIESSETLTLDDTTREAYALISRFLGLFMSSSRLPVNQRREPFQVSALERAREVQMSYLPAQCAATDRYEIFGYNQSSALVGGDYFDYFCHRRRTLQFVVADACGHGMPAALTICTFRELLHGEVRHMTELEGLFDELNRKLYTNADQLRYLTAVFFDFDENNGELRYFNAGHHKPLIVRASGEHHWLEGGGLPLGMFGDARYELQSCHVAPGDLLVLFTDGVVDIQNVQEEFFGIEGVLDAVMLHRGSALTEMVRGVLSRAEQFNRSTEPDDDLPVFGIRFR